MKKFLKSCSCILLVAMLATLMSIATLAAPSNTSFSTATQLSSDIGDHKVITGISTGTSVYYYLNATAGQQIYAAIYSMTGGANYDLRLYNSSQTLLASSTRTSSSIDYISYNATYTGKYYVRIQAVSVSSTSYSCGFKVTKTCGVAGTSSTNSGYNRTSAKNYMDLYAITPNPSYNDYTGNGGDCTNFASQVVKAGGMATISGSSSSEACWYAYSETWKSATKFTNHWGTSSVGNGNKRAYSCQYFIGQDAINNYQTFIQNLKVGDIIQRCQQSDSSRVHTMIIYQKDTNNILMAQHTGNKKNVNLNNYLNTYKTSFFVVIRVKQG